MLNDATSPAFTFLGDTLGAGRDTQGGDLRDGSAYAGVARAGWRHAYLAAAGLLINAQLLADSIASFPERGEHGAAVIAAMDGAPRAGLKGTAHLRRAIRA